MKRSPRKRLLRVLDATFAAYIRARDPVCVTCGAPTEHCSHVFRRWHKATAWMEENAYGQCARCHNIHHRQSESFLLDYAREKLGRGAYENLRDAWQGISDWKDYQLAEMARYYKAKLEALGGK